MPLIINNPYLFERVVGELFQKMGYATTVTPRSGDYGIDVIAKKGTEVIAIQVKFYKPGNNIRNVDVRNLLGAMQYAKVRADKAILITSSDFTVMAREQAKETPIELWNGAYIKSMLKRYFNDDVIFDHDKKAQSQNIADVINSLNTNHQNSEINDNNNNEYAILDTFPKLLQSDKNIIIDMIKRKDIANATKTLSNITGISIIESIKIISEIIKESHINVYDTENLLNSNPQNSTTNDAIGNDYSTLDTVERLSQSDKNIIIEMIKRRDTANATRTLSKITGISITESIKIISEIIKKNHINVYDTENSLNPNLQNREVSDMIDSDCAIFILNRLPKLSQRDKDIIINKIAHKDIPSAANELSRATGMSNEKCKQVIDDIIKASKIRKKYHLDVSDIVNSLNTDLQNSGTNGDINNEYAILNTIPTLSQSDKNIIIDMIKRKDTLNATKTLSRTTGISTSESVKIIGEIRRKQDEKPALGCCIGLFVIIAILAIYFLK